MQSLKHRISLNRIIFIGLCLILIWTPIPLGSNRPWAWSVMQLLIGGCFVLHIIRAWHYNQYFFGERQRWLWLTPLLVLLGWLSLQSAELGLTSADPYQSQIMAVKTLFFILWCFLLQHYCADNQRLRLLAIVLVGTGALQAFYGVVLQLSDFTTSPVIGMLEGQRARGSFVYQNHFANYLALCLAVAIGVLLSQLSSRRTHRNWRQLSRDTLATLLSAKMMLRLAMVLMVIGLVMSRSRMGNAAFFTALITVAVAALWLYKRPPALLKPLVVSLLVLDMLVIGSMFGIEKLQQRYAETSFASEARDNVVMDSLPLLEQYWLTGSGGGSFYTVFPQVQPAPYSGFYDHAHNDYLQFAIEIGMPMTALLFSWLAWLGWQALSLMRHSDDKLTRGISFAVLMALMHMGLHSLVDFSLQAPANALLFLTILSMVPICIANEQKRTLTRAVRR